METFELNETKLNNTFILASNNSKRLITKNLVPGLSVYNEKLIHINNEEFRIWEPFRSKLASMVLKGSSISLSRDHSVLYLGAANGTTVSHISDIVTDGEVFAIEISPRAVRDLIRVSSPRVNMVPILADARKPVLYQHMVSLVDVIYQDIAQRDQAGIAIRNADLFLRKNGTLILVIKARSIDTTRNPRGVADAEAKKLKKIFRVIELVNLEPQHLDHFAVVAQKIV